jgi:hypothetical protein
MELRKFIQTTIREYLNEQQILNEGATDILYHFTSVGALINILKTNAFALTLSLPNSPDFNLNKNRYYYLSTTRSKNSGYKLGDARIKLDGRKLNQNNKVTPVDYWQYSKSPKDWDEKTYINALSSEQEDRIISNKPSISNASKYIIAMEVVINNNIKSLIYYAEKYDIPLFVYRNKEDLLLSKNPINHYEYRDGNYIENKDDEVKLDYYLYDIASLLAYNNEDNYNKIVNNLIDGEEELKNFNEVLEKNTYNYFKLNARYAFETMVVIKNRIDNTRRNADKNSKFIFNMLIDDIKKMGVNSLEDYLKAKQWKGIKTDDDYKKELFNYLINIIDKSFATYLDGNLSGYIEIDGEYYNDIKDSQEVISFITSYVNKIKTIVKQIIFDEQKEILRYNFYLSKNEIEKFIDIKSVKIDNKLNITDYRYDFEEINKDIYNIIYFILSDIDDESYNKIKQIQTDMNKRYN